MVRRNDESERSKVRVFYAEVEGGDQSIQELVRALGAAMGRQPQIVIPARAPKALPAPERNEQTAAAQAAETENHDLASDEVLDDLVDERSQRRKRGSAHNRDRNAGLAIVKSLDLHPVGKQSLKDFVNEKRPRTQIESIAVYMYYLKRILELPKVGFAHCLTCFKEVGERVPGNLPQSCRNASQKGWIDTSDQDNLDIATRGANLVEHELPAHSGQESEGE